MPDSAGRVQITNEAFLRGLFDEAWTRAHVCGFDEDPQTPGLRAWKGGHAGKRLAGLRASSNNYYVISTFTGKVRTTATFEALYVLAVDDVGVKVKPRRVVELLGEPTYRLETSPGNEQWGYRLVTPATDAAAVERVQKALVWLLTGTRQDPGLRNVTRYMRLPQGHNRKAELVAQFGELGFPCKLREWRPELVFAWSAIESTIELAAGADMPKRVTVGVVNDSAEVADPVVVEALQELGRIAGEPVHTAGGWGWDVECLWREDHTSRADTGAMYFCSGGYKCFHGHCQDRGPADVRPRVEELLAAAGLPSLAARTFEVFDAAGALPPAELEVVERFWSETVFLSAEARFASVVTRKDESIQSFNAYWGPLLRRYGLPPMPEGAGQPGRPKGPPSPAQWYFANLKRRRMIDAQIWYPGKPVVFFDPEVPQRLIWNSCVPPRASLAVDLDITPWLDLIRYLIPDQAVGEQVLDWLALVVGDLGRRAGWHVMLVGETHGSGKDMAIQPLQRWLGDLARNLSIEQLESPHNTWVQSRLVARPEQASRTRGQPSGRDHYVRLKELLDNRMDWITVNPKYVRPYRSRNVFMMWMTSNEGSPLPLEPSDRRFLVWRTKAERKPTEYYESLLRWFEAESDIDGLAGYERVVAVLQARWRDIDADPARRRRLMGAAPMTEAKAEVIEQARPAIEQALRELLEHEGDAALRDLVTVEDLLPTLRHMLNDQRLNARVVGRHMKNAGTSPLDEGRQIRVEGRRIRLWVTRNKMKYDRMSTDELIKAYLQGMAQLRDET